MKKTTGQLIQENMKNAGGSAVRKHFMWLLLGVLTLSLVFAMPAMATEGYDFIYNEYGKIEIIGTMSQPPAGYSDIITVRSGAFINGGDWSGLTVQNSGTISGGTFGTVDNYGTISGGTFGTVYNYGTVSGGTFDYLENQGGTIQADGLSALSQLRNDTGVVKGAGWQMNYKTMTIADGTTVSYSNVPAAVWSVCSTVTGGTLSDTDWSYSGGVLTLRSSFNGNPSDPNLSVREVNNPSSYPPIINNGVVNTHGEYIQNTPFTNKGQVYDSVFYSVAVENSNTIRAKFLGSSSVVSNTGSILVQHNVNGTDNYLPFGANTLVSALNDAAGTNDATSTWKKNNGEEVLSSEVVPLIYSSYTASSTVLTGDGWTLNDGVLTVTGTLTNEKLESLSAYNSVIVTADGVVDSGNNKPIPVLVTNNGIIASGNFQAQVINNNRVTGGGIRGAFENNGTVESASFFGAVTNYGTIKKAYFGANATLAAESTGMPELVMHYVKQDEDTTKSVYLPYNGTKLVDALNAAYGTDGRITTWKVNGAAVGAEETVPLCATIYTYTVNGVAGEGWVLKNGTLTVTGNVNYADLSALTYTTLVNEGTLTGEGWSLSGTVLTVTGNNKFTGLPDKLTATSVVVAHDAYINYDLIKDYGPVTNNGYINGPSGAWQLFRDTEGALTVHSNFDSFPDALRNKVQKMIHIRGGIYFSTIEGFLNGSVVVDLGGTGFFLLGENWKLEDLDEGNGRLTVKDSGFTGLPAELTAALKELTISSVTVAENATVAYDAVKNYGTLTNNGTLTGEGWSLTGTALTVPSGQTADLSTVPAQIMALATQVVNNGTITGGSCAVPVTNNGVITGGTFKGTVTNESEGIVFKVANGVTIDPGATLVNRGVMTGDGWTLEKDVLTIEVDKSVDLDKIPANVKSLAKQVVNKGTITDGSCAVPVTNRGYIDGGTFTGAVTNEYYIFRGTFTGTVTNNENIIGGTFNGTVTNETSGHITGGSFQTINNQAGARLQIPAATYKTLNNQGRVEANEYYVEASIAALGLVKNIALNQIPKDFRDQTKELLIDGSSVTVNVDELKELPNLERIENGGTIAGNGWNVKNSILTVEAGERVDLGSILPVVMERVIEVVNRGTITGTLADGCADPVFNHGTIEGGTFTGTVTNEAGGTLVLGSFQKIVNKKNGCVNATSANLTYDELENQGIFKTRDYKFDAATSTVDLLTNDGFAKIPDAWKAQTTMLVIHSNVTFKAEYLATLSKLASIENSGTIAGTGWELFNDVLHITGSVDLKDVPANIMNMVDAIEVLNVGTLTNTATGSCTLKVTNNGTVSGGSFGASFTNSSTGNVYNAAFTGEVTNKGTINSSTFTGGKLTTSDASSYIGDSTYENITIIHQAGNIRGKFLGSARIDEYNGSVMSLHNVNGEDILLTGNSSELITELNAQTHQDADTVIWYHGTEADPGEKVAEGETVPLYYASFHSAPVVTGNGFTLHKGVLTINGDATMADLEERMDSVTSIVMESGGTLTGDGWVLSSGVLTIKQGKSVDLSTVPANVMALVTQVTNHGTITGTPAEGCVVPVTNYGTISGGEFNGSTTNCGTVSGGSFSASFRNYGGGDVYNGTFSGTVTNEFDGTIEGGTFSGTVTNKSDGTIKGGTFAADVSNSGTIECAKFLVDRFEGNSPKKVIHSVNGVDTALKLSKTHPGVNEALEDAGVILGDEKILYKNGGRWWYTYGSDVPLIYTTYAVGSQVTVAADPAAGGTVAFTPAEGIASINGAEYVPAGTTVTVTITENAPYHFESLTVRDSGNQITTQFVENKEQTYTFTFTMPAVPVTATAVFALPSGIDWELSLLDGQLVLTLGSGFNGRLDEEPLLSMLGYAASIENFGTILGDGWKLEGGVLTIEKGKSIDLNSIPAKIMKAVTEIVNNGTITGGSCSAVVTNNGTIANGNFTNVFNQRAGTIEGGTFSRGVTNLGKIQGGSFMSSVTCQESSSSITGGTFNGKVTTKDKATISGGTFSSTVTNKLGATIKGGTFSGTVTNNGATIKGGRFEGTNCYVLVTETTATLHVTGSNVKLPSYPASYTHAVIEQGVEAPYSAVGGKLPYQNLTNNGAIVGTDWRLEGTKLINNDNTLGVESEIKRDLLRIVTELENNGTIKDFSYFLSSGEWLYLTGENPFNMMPQIFKDVAQVVIVYEGMTIDYADIADLPNVTDIGNNGVIEGEGWKASGTKLTIEAGATVDLDDLPALIMEDIESIENNGTISGGSFTGHVTNNGIVSGGEFSGGVGNTGSITGGEFSDVVTNIGSITGGTFSQLVTNSGTVEGGVFASRFTNCRGGVVQQDATGDVPVFYYHVHNDPGATISDGFFEGSSTVQNYGSITGGRFVLNEKAENVQNNTGGTIDGGTITGGVFATHYYELDIQDDDDILTLKASKELDKLTLPLPSWYDDANVKKLHVNIGVTLEILDNRQREMTVYNYGKIESYIAGSSGVMHNYGEIDTLEVESDGVVQNLQGGKILKVNHQVSIYGADYEMKSIRYTTEQGEQAKLLDSLNSLDLANSSEDVWFRQTGETLTAVADNELVPMQVQQFVLLRPYELENNIVRIPAGLGQDEVKQQLCQIVEGRLEAQINPADSENQLYDLTATFVRQEGDKVTVAVAANGTRAPGYLESNTVTVNVVLYQPVSADWVTSGKEAGVVKFGASVSGTLHITWTDGSSEKQMTEEVTNITEYDAARWLWAKADGTVLAWVETAENGVTYPLTQTAKMDFEGMKLVEGFRPVGDPAEVKVYYGSNLVLNAKDFMGGFAGTLKDRPEVALKILDTDEFVTYDMHDEPYDEVVICFKASDSDPLYGPMLNCKTQLKVYPNPDHFDLSIDYENETVRVAFSKNAPSAVKGQYWHSVRYGSQVEGYLHSTINAAVSIPDKQFGKQMTLNISPENFGLIVTELSIDIPARPELEVALTHVTHEKNTFHVTKAEKGCTVKYGIGGEWQQLTGDTLDVYLTQTAPKTVQFQIPADATAKRFKNEVTLTIAEATPPLTVTGGTGLVSETLMAQWWNDNRVNGADIRYAWIWANTGTAARGTKKEYTPDWSDAGKNLQALATCEVNGVTYATVSELIPISLPAPLYAIDYEAETLTVSLPEGAPMPSSEGFAYRASWCCSNGNDVEWRDATAMVDGKAVISLTGVLDDENDDDWLTAVKLELLEGETFKASSTTTLDKAVSLIRSMQTAAVPPQFDRTPVSITFSNLMSVYEYRLTKDGTVYTHDGNGVFSGLTSETKYAMEGRISGSNEKKRFAGNWEFCREVATSRKYELYVKGLTDDELHHTYLVDGNVPVISLTYDAIGTDPIFTQNDKEPLFTVQWPDDLAAGNPLGVGTYTLPLVLTEEAGKAYLLNNGTVRVLVEPLDLGKETVISQGFSVEYNDGEAVELPVIDLYVSGKLLPKTDYHFEHPEGAKFTAGENGEIYLVPDSANIIGSYTKTYTIKPKKVKLSDQNLTATYSGSDVKAKDLVFEDPAFEAEWSVASAYDWKDAADNVLTGAPKNVGTYTATLKLYHNDHGDNYDVEPVECTVTITPLGLTLNEDYDNDLGLKVYDGTTKVSGLPKALNLEGLIFEGDDVQGEMDGSFASKNVSDEQTVTTTYTLTGKDAGNYYVKDGTFGDVFSVEGSVSIAKTGGQISPLSLTATYTFVKNERVWDGLGIIPKEHLAIELNALEGDDVTLAMDDLIAMTANYEVGSYSQAENEIMISISDSNSLTGDDAANYNFKGMVPADENLTYTIKPMDLADETRKWHLNQHVACFYTGDHTVDLPAGGLQMQMERQGMTDYMHNSELEFVLTGDDVNGLPGEARILVKAAENASRVTGSAYFPVYVQHAPVEIYFTGEGETYRWNPGYEKTVDELFGDKVLVTSMDYAPVEKDYFTRVMKDANGNEVEKTVNAGKYSVTFVLNEEGAKRYVPASENELISHKWVYPMDVIGNAFIEQTFENPVYTGNAVYPAGMLKVMILNYDVPFEIPVDGELVRFVPIEGENCVNAGTAKARIEACHPNMTGYMDVTYQILPCEVTVEEIVFEEKIYDGTLAVTVDRVVLNNLAEGDEVSASAIRAELLSPDAGENKANVQLRLEGEDSANYILTEEQVQWPVTVRKAQPAAIVWPAEKTLVFGTKLSEVAPGANMQWLNPDHIPEVHETTAKVRYVPADTRNYDYSNVKLEYNAPIKVLPAEAILTVDSKTVQKGDSLSFTYTWEGLVEGFAKPTVTLWVDSTEVGTHDIKVTVTDADNYAVKVNHGKLTVTGPEPEVTFRPTPTVKPDATPTAKPDATPTAKPDATPTAKPDATPTAKPDATPTAKPDATPTAKPDATPTAKPDATPTAKPEATATVKPDATPTAKPDATPTAKPEATATAKPDATPTAKPDATPTAKPDATPTAKPDATPTAKPDVTPDATPAVPAVPEVPVTPEDVIIPETDQAATGMMGEGQRYGDLQLVFDGEGNPRDYELNIVPQAGKVETMLHIVACQEAEGNADRSLVLPLKTLKMLSDRHVADCTLFETEEVLVFFRHAEVLQGKLAALVGYVTTGGIVTENVLQHVDMLDAVEALTAEQLGQVTLEVHVEKTESGFKVSMLLGFENDKWDVTHLIESFTLCMNVEKLVTEENKANFTELYTVVRTDENGEETLVPAVLCIVPDELPADMQDVCASYTVSMPEQEGDSITVTHDEAAELDAYRKHVLMCEGALSGVYELRAAQ